MSSEPPFQFEFIRKLCAHLPEEEIIAADVRFAHLLDILRDVAASEAARKINRDNRFDEIAPAPHDLSPPTQSV